MLLPGFAVGLAMALQGTSRERWRAAGWWLAGVVLPLGLLWAWFAWGQAGGEFWHYNFALNARWIVQTNPWPLLLFCLMFHAPLALVGLLGLGAVTRAETDDAAPDHFGWLLVWVTASGLGGLALLPVVNEYYYLLLLPGACCLAARGLDWAVSRWPTRHPTVAFAAVLVLACANAFVILLNYIPRIQTNQTQLDAIETVQRVTAPGDMVLEGGSGAGVFRPHGFFYFFPHEEIRAMIPAKELRRLETDLEGGLLVPRLIVLDADLLELSGRVNQWVETNCQPLAASMCAGPAANLWIPKAVRAGEKQIAVIPPP